MSFERALFVVDLAAAFWNGLLAALLFALYRADGRAYLRDWSKSWLALAVSGIAAAVPMYLGFATPDARGIRFVALVLWLATTYWQAIWLIAGTHAVATGGDPPRRLVRVLAWGALVLAVVIAVGTSESPAPKRFAIRTGSAYGVIVAAFFVAAASILRRISWRRDLGRAMVGLGFLIHGFQRIVGILAIAVSWGRPTTGGGFLSPFFYLALAEFMVFAWLALGMMVWLLEEQRTEARRTGALAALGTLVAGVAHEARNPLFGITATIDAFEAGRGKGPEFEGFLSNLRQSTGRLSRLMEQLLDLGRPGAEERARVSLAVLLDEAIAATRALSERGGVEVSVRVGPPEPSLAVDRERMTQVFRNLVENAVQHSAPGGSVVVSADRVEDGRSLIEVRVADSGPGFSSEDLPHVFDPFFTRRRGGTGLGLAIVRRVVEDHGGQVAGRNRAPRGAEVVVRLPAG